jgi:hypothetical protein
MPVTLDLSVSELAETRFAVSPLSETISGLQQLAHGRPWEGNRRWMHWATDDLAARPLELARTWPLIVNDRSSWPQFLLPLRTILGRNPRTLEGYLSELAATA